MTIIQAAEENSDGSVTYPPGLPKDRGMEGGAWQIAAVVILLAVAAGQSTSESNSVILLISLFSLCVLAIIMTQLTIIRPCLLMEERHHIEGRYNGDWHHLLSDIWSLNIETVLTLGVSFIVVLVAWMTLGNLFLFLHEFGIYSSSFVFLAANVYCHLIQVEKSSLKNSMNLEYMDGMDYGSSMAYGFFYGYLQIILPDKEGAVKGIKERIDDYISREKLNDARFPVHKLFILIPSSLFTPSKLNEISDGWMEPAGNLDEQIFNRAGVTDRVYKNSVYRIKNPSSNEEPLYVVAEGATPLKTLYDALQHSGERQDFYKRHQKEILSMFYKTLRQIIRSDRDCRDVCELVYYIDTDKHGERCVNVAELLYQRIQKLRSQQRT